MLSWIAGAFDSLGLGDSRVQEDAPVAAAAAVSAVTRVRPDTNVMLALGDLLGDLSGPRAVDQFMEAIRNEPGLSRGRVAELARWWCRNGTRKGTVRVGLALLGATGDESDQFLILRLGLLEELSLYAVVALRNLLADPEPALFELAQNVSGWGRINAIQRLQGTSNPEIKSWLLRGGAEDGVMTEEIAWVAATTGELRSALEQESDEALLEHGAELLRALAQGGPSKDMSDYPDGAAAMGAFFDHMATGELTPKRVNCIVYLEQYLTEWARDNTLISEEERLKLGAAVTTVLTRPGCVRVVHDLLASEEIWDVTTGLSLSGRFGIDGRPTAHEWLQRRPFTGYLWQWLFRSTADPDEIDALIQKAYELLPLADLGSGPEDNLGMGRDYAADSALRIIIQALKPFPGRGWPLIAAALANRVTGNRNGAMQVLDAWPVEDWPDEASTALVAARNAEPKTDVRDRIQTLLDTGKLPDGS